MTPLPGRERGRGGGVFLKKLGYYNRIDTRGMSSIIHINACTQKKSAYWGGRHVGDCVEGFYHFKKSRNKFVFFENLVVLV